MNILDKQQVLDELKDINENSESFNDQVVKLLVLIVRILLIKK